MSASSLHRESTDSLICVGRSLSDPYENITLCTRVYNISHVYVYRSSFLYVGVLLDNRRGRLEGHSPIAPSSVVYILDLSLFTLFLLLPVADTLVTLPLPSLSTSFTPPIHAQRKHNRHSCCELNSSSHNYTIQEEYTVISGHSCAKRKCQN